MARPAGGTEQSLDGLVARMKAGMRSVFSGPTAWFGPGQPIQPSAPATVEGEGLVETFAWETQAGYALHVLNYTNPGAFKGWIREYYPIGEQRVKMSIPQGRRVSRVQLLRSGKDIPFNRTEGAIEFVIPGVLDYEIAAMYAT